MGPLYGKLSDLIGELLMSKHDILELHIIHQDESLYYILPLSSSWYVRVFELKPIAA